jgi:lipopolysaccharide transport system ATP-binding protein
MHVAIDVQGLGKRYRLGVRQETSDTLVGRVAGWVRAPLRSFTQLRRLTRFANGVDDADSIWALRDVSFRLAEGEALGIIGRNGAGKSTLLKVLSRITPPTTGRASTHGRVASLLEVGTGFHPELTGRENIYLNGTLLGMMRREIDRKLDEIVDFAGIGKFLDTPIKRYSSGMQVRLAFSVAAHLDAEILIVDEVLAVGDLEFQRKCLGRMSSLLRNGRTVLFVSHNMPVVKNVCSRGIVLADGRVTFDGESSEAVGVYMASAPIAASGGPVPAQSIRYSTGEAIIRRAEVESASALPYRSAIGVRMEVEVREPIRDLLVDIKIQSADGTVVAYATNTLKTGEPERVEPGIWNLSAALENPLHPGDYTISLGLHRSTGHTMFVAEELCPFSIDRLGEGQASGYPYSWAHGYVALESTWSRPTIAVDQREHVVSHGSMSAG